MPEPFQYATIRVVPRIERDEFVNVGVIVFCRTRGYLAAAVRLEPEHELALRALDPDIDLPTVGDNLRALVRVAAGEAEAGPVAALPQSERFHWLVAPSSTIVQTSPVHSGLCDDGDRVLERLLASLVSRPAPS